jgi:dynein light chain LC8-type
MIKDSFKAAKEAKEKFAIEKDIAQYIKEYFDSIYRPNWHCIVGK